jgi:large subunit ribosomal protein L23
MGFFNRSKTKKPEEKKPAAPKDEKAAVAAPAKKAAPAETGDAHRLLMRPLVTEKSSAMSKNGTYVFAVAPDATKLEVKTAIKSVYGVDVADVRVMVVRGKRVRTRTGFSHRKNWRKAIVTLKKGTTLDVFANA